MRQTPHGTFVIGGGWPALVDADGRDFMSDAWWIATFPGLAIMITVLGFNFFGDALRDALDPKMGKRQ